jgi:kynurenine formamidase
LADEARILEVFSEVKNWDRWGEDDELGTLNLITPEVVTRAAQTIQDGLAIGCGQLDFKPSRVNQFPARHYMTAAGDSAKNPCGIMADFMGIEFHGPNTTHIDALCHMVFEGKMYNGRSADLVRSTGAEANAITSLRDGINTRGVLLDIAALRGVPFIEPAEAIHAAELDQACEAIGIEPRDGDALIFRVGRHVRRAEQGIDVERLDNGDVNLAGLHFDCLPWLHRHGISLLMSDGGNDVLPSGYEVARIPIHIGSIVYMGLHLLDNAVIERLASACAERRRWEFFFSIAPLMIDGGTGSPVNPIAIF